MPPNNQEAKTGQTRTAAHTRTTTCTSYHRADGNWDIEATIEDIKHYDHTMLERGLVPAGQPYHSISVKLTTDDELKIIAATGRMSSTPFGECQRAINPLQGLVGATLGRGWRKSVDQALIRNQSCTHMREMLYTIASAAIQAIPGYLPQINGKRWPPQFAPDTPQPAFIGGCISWREDGEVVLRQYPQFHISSKP